MHKNNLFHRLILSPIALMCLFYGSIMPLNGCAKSKQKESHSPIEESGIQETEAGSEPAPDAELFVYVDAALSNDGSFGPTTDVPEQTTFQVPKEVEEEFGKLNNPDFSKPLEDLAAETCGYTQMLRAVDEDNPDCTITEERAFDASGRLLAAEMDIPEECSPYRSETFTNHSRLQIDYNSSGKPVLIRMSPFFYVQENEYDIRGTTISISYHPDGSQISQLITDEHSLLGDIYGYRVDVLSEGQPFCETLHFDAEGGFVERRWECTNPQLVQSRTYDDQHRPLLDRKIDYEPLEYQEPPWEIQWMYDDSQRTVTAIWSEKVGSWICAEVNPFGTDSIPPIEKHTIVEQRLIRVLDDSGRITAIQFDNLNDGNMDEQVDFTYEDGELILEETDFWMDDMVDIVKTRTNTTDGFHIDSHNMTGYFDAALYFRSTLWWSDLFVDIYSTPPGQGQLDTEVLLDELGRISETNVSAQWPKIESYENVLWTAPDLVSVSASWQERVTYADTGFTTKRELMWQPSDSLSEVGLGSDQRWGSRFSDDHFSAVKQTTSCTYTSACDSPNMVFPEDERLVSCDTMVLFPQYVLSEFRPYINQTELFIVPPYDALPGIQNTMNRLGIYSLRGMVFFQPPSPRDLVDY